MSSRVMSFVLRNDFLHALGRPVYVFANWCPNLLWWAIRRYAIGRYLQSHQQRRLQIGAGPTVLEGWLNTDKFPDSRRVVFLNATKRFPFKDATFDYIFSEHLIEHLNYAQGRLMLAECYRVLKPGGKVRVATPDLQRLVDLYCTQRSATQERYIGWITRRFLPEGTEDRECFVMNNAFRNWGHQFLYDAATLGDLMERAGFRQVVLCNVGESEDEVLQGIECHGKTVDEEEANRYETMVLEARRPAGPGADTRVPRRALRQESLVR